MRQRWTTQTSFAPPLCPPPPLTATSQSLQHLRFLALKNLGDLLADDGAAAELSWYPTAGSPDQTDRGFAVAAQAKLQRQGKALRAYGTAAMEMSGDVTLWQRLAELAALMNQAGIARYALECGLKHSPRHTRMLEQLMQVCLSTQEYLSS